MSELVGIYEIAQMAGVSRQVVVNWRTRNSDFPVPKAELRAGPVFDRIQITRWLQRRRNNMTQIIATINLKGGVGKTTTTVAIAEFLAESGRNKVLLIDLDPQTNATTLLIGEERWKQLNAEGNTLAQLFKDALETDRTKRTFDLAKTLQKNVSPVAEVTSLDLLPSSLDLIDVQDRLASMSAGNFYSNVPTEVLRRAVRPIVDDYDFILIDCPPNLGIVTLNGLRIAGGYIIPVIPDYLSTYGIPQIQTRIHEFAEAIGEPIDPLGIVISKYRHQVTVHRNVVERLKDHTRDGYIPVFNTIIPEAANISASAEYAQNNTLRQKYGYGQLRAYDLYKDLAEEIVNAAGD